MNVLITQNSQNLSHNHSEESAGSHTHTTDSQSTKITTSGEGAHGHTIAVSQSYAQRTYKKYVAANDGGASDYGGSDLGYATSAVSGGAHQHSFPHTHTTDSQGAHTHTINASGGTETRTVNYSYKVWKRVS